VHTFAKNLTQFFPNTYLLPCLHQSGSTPLLHAAMHGNLDTVQLLLSWRVDINARNDVSTISSR
jgi:ankyrin repeat protein